MKKIKFELRFVRDMENEVYASFVDKIVRNTKGHGIKDPVVLKLIDRLEGLRPVLLEKGVYSVLHKNTDLIQDIYLENRELLRSIRHWVDGAMLGETDEMRNHGNELNVWLYHFRKSFGKRNQDVQIDLIRRLRATMSDYEATEEAIDALHLRGRFDKLFENYDDWMSLSNERNSDQANTKSRLEMRRERSYQYLRNLLNTLQMMANSDIDDRELYHSVCVPLVHIVKSAHAIEKFRKTMRLKKKAREKSEDSGKEGME